MSNERATELIDSLFRKERKGMFRFAKTILNNIDLACDAVQETFEFALKNPDKILTSPSPVGWLYNSLNYIARNKRVTENRFQKVLMKLEVSDLYENEENIDLKFKNIVLDDDFKLLKLVYLEKVTYKEAAHSLGMTTAAFGMKLRRIKKQFIENYKKEE